MSANRQNNFVIKYVECEHLREMQKQFSDLRTSAGWRSNLKGCCSNRTERKIMRKIMRKERTMNRWSRTMKWEREVESFPFLYVCTHTHVIRFV